MVRLPTQHGSAHRSGPPTTTVSMSSRLTLRRHRDIPAFLSAALRLRRLFRDAQGGVTLDLSAQPLRRTFWTFSVWADDQSLNAYVSDASHVDVMKRFRARMADSSFDRSEQSSLAPSASLPDSSRSKRRSTSPTTSSARRSTKPDTKSPHDR